MQDLEKCTVLPEFHKNSNNKSLFWSLSNFYTFKKKLWHRDDLSKQNSKDMCDIKVIKTVKVFKYLDRIVRM